MAGLPSIAAATGRPSCEKSAEASCSASGLTSAGFGMRSDRGANLGEHEVAVGGSAGALAGQALVRQDLEAQRRDARPGRPARRPYRCRSAACCRPTSKSPVVGNRDGRPRGRDRAGRLERLPGGQLFLHARSQADLGRRQLGRGRVQRLLTLAISHVELRELCDSFSSGSMHLFLDADGDFFDVGEEGGEAVKILASGNGSNLWSWHSAQPSVAPSQTVEALRTRSAAYLASVLLGLAPPSRVVISRWL